MHIAILPSGRYYYDGLDEQQRRAEEDRLNADIRKRISASAELHRKEREEWTAGA